MILFMVANGRYWSETTLVAESSRLGLFLVQRVILLTRIPLSDRMIDIMIMTGRLEYVMHNGQKTI
jgi:hypothetical protein